MKIEENPLAIKSGDILIKRCTKIHNTFADSLDCVDCQSTTNREKVLLSHISTLEEKVRELENKEIGLRHFIDHELREVETKEEDEG